MTILDKTSGIDVNKNERPDHCLYGDMNKHNLRTMNI
jgi:hypothetical protein